ncbi:helix-turn-helix transcriptional regulator [Vulcanococcus sp. Clear-D1]|uniref:helix-turn-helix domain-containing protein n=1 Tax=Vulcanococcus sp. Clear-D1 TaxID=2766970 RepID=UPI001987A25A|nr:helix-turn-helix transcriptional regulator [Vulcanococcus sp. Clear-D1]MBD1193157.1 helix-turn-helix transcriptional regulator [Vulcanococcus sp. Clear-D1]
MLPASFDRPLLLNTAWASSVSGADELAQMLASTYTVCDLEPIAPPLQRSSPLQLQVAAAVLGGVGLTSVLGEPITLEVRPKQSFCLLALPSSGWGRYSLGRHQIDNNTGQTVAFLPPEGWRLDNDCSSGTGLQFSQASLITRMRAMANQELSAAALASLLSVPFVVRLDVARNAYYYQHLLAALELVDSSFRHGPGQPDPMLCLDDFVLRCIALLLHPTLSELEAQGVERENDPLLRRCVHELMEWMLANLHRPLSLSEIEQQVHYGRRMIQIGFKREVGCGPMQWLRRQRLDRAHQHLQAASLGVTVSQVAQSCGYLHLASFSRDFRERFGVSARELLAQSRAGRGLN